MRKVFWVVVTLSALCPLCQIQAQSPHSTVSQIDAMRSAEVTCSSGRRFATKVRWRFKKGIVIEQVSSDGTIVPRRELLVVNKLMGAATYLDYVQMWCSGDNDGGIRMAYSTIDATRPTQMLLDLQIRGRQILLGSNVVRPLM